MNHICKIEGHAHLSLKIENNIVKTCQLKAAEGARFFESLVIGKNIEDIQEIVSRICGICSCAHSVASIQALENALKIKPSEQQKTIREILMIGERIRSNTTHLYFLTLPDYYGVSSALSLGKEHKEKINNAITLISLGNKIVQTFGGREIHPFLAIKEKSPETNLEPILEQLIASKPLIVKTIELFKNLSYIDLERKTDYLSLKEQKDYGIISGKIASKSGLIDEKDYSKHLNERIKQYATSKFVLKDNKPYVTGAIARINNNHDQLDEETKEHLKNIKLPLTNPLENNIAQALELLHLTNRAIYLIKKMNPKPEKLTYKIRPGRGVSAVEAPRGTLFHEYKISRQGKITYCNIITPTAQNLNMMEKDITTLVNQLLSKKTTKTEIVNEIEKLIRAYDPCFSCSTHFLKVKWL